MRIIDTLPESNGLQWTAKDSCRKTIWLGQQCVHDPRVEEDPGQRIWMN